MIGSGPGSPANGTPVPPLIVVVDDQPRHAARLRELLEPAGHVLVLAETASEAERVLLSLRPNLLLISTDLPEGAGFELCRAVRARLAPTVIPVLFLNSERDLASRVEAFRAGGVDVLSRPWRREEVLARVRTHLTLFRTMQELQETRQDLDRRVRDRTRALETANTELVREVRLRRQAEQALLRSESQLKEAQRIGRLGYWELNAAEGELSWSEEMYRLFGRRVADGPSLEAWQEPFEGSELAERVEALAREPGEWGADLEARFPDGRTRTCRVRLQSVLGPSGRMDLRGTVQDVTSVSRLESKLRQAEKLKAVGRLAGGIACDFNNQLSGILGFAESLQPRLPDEGMQTCLSEIISFANRASRLTSQLLAFGRKESSGERVVDMHILLGEVLSFAEAAVERGVSIEQTFEAEQATVLGHRERLEDAIMKLVLNARDAVYGEGEIHCSTRLLRDTLPNDVLPVGASRPRTWFVLSIFDDGEGMTPEVQSRIFEPFFTTREQQSGLGLSAVYGTVTGLGGALRVHSVPAQGTTVEVFLPLYDIADPGAGGRLPIVEDAPAVLVIEEESAVCELLGAMITDLDYRVRLFDDAQQALEHYRESFADYGLILLDMKLAREAGLRVFRALRAIDERARIMLLSSRRETGVARQALNEGARGVIEKPFRLSDLSQALRRAM